MTGLRKQIRLAGLAMALAAPALASYHYIHYSGRTAPFTPIYEKFDLAALPNNTVTFFVSDQGPAVFAPRDNFGSVLSQVKQAAAAWNSVATSDLRVAFGGLESYTPNPTVLAPGGPTLPSSTPGADIIFVDLPGVLGLGAPTTSTVAVTPPNGQSFFPIVRSLVMLSRDTTQAAGASYLESYFTTAIHEMGHALGLQHTWTGSAMSQDKVRNTSRARPLEADDIAAISILYGKPDWQSNYGSITGRVAFAGTSAPVALASVVAISASGPAVSTLTDPNGNYRIDGLPLSYNYSVYVHPLPPGATQSSQLRMPVDLSFQPFAASTPFQSVFYPGVLNPAQATGIAVAAGAPVTGINFTVQPRGAVPTYDVETFAWYNSATRTLVNGDKVVQPAYVNTNDLWGTVVARALAPAFLPNPVSMTILGGFSPALFNAAPPQPYISNYEYGTMAAYFPMFGLNPGPRHLVFTFADDMYVLPNGVTAVRQGPPAVRSVTPNPDGSVTISGAGLGSDSVVYFDGVPAVSQTAVTQTPVPGNDAGGFLTVTPPQGVSGQIATITVYNSDGQNSMLLQADNPPTYPYPAAPVPAVTSVSVTSLPASTSAAIEINAVNTNFVDGQVTVGFGTNDIAVRRVWVMSPTRLLANVTVAGNATPGASQISVISGLAILPQAGSFLTQAVRAGAPFLALPVVNGDASRNSLYAGSTAVLYGQNLAVSASAAQVTLNDVSAVILFANSNQINFLVPAGVTAGPATLRLNTGSAIAQPVTVQIDNPPPAIAAVNNTGGALVASSLGASVSAGDLLNVLVTGLDPAVAVRARAQVSGIEMPVQQVVALPGGGVQLQVMLTQSFAGARVPVTISLDGSASAPFYITVR